MTKEQVEVREIGGSILAWLVRTGLSKKETFEVTAEQDYLEATHSSWGKD